MPRADDRIRWEFRSVHRSVSGEGVFELVEERRRQLRLLRRAKVAVLGVVVLAGTAIGTTVLMRAFGTDGPSFGPANSPSVEPTTATPTPVAVCFPSSLTADLNGDGLDDTVTVYSAAASCDSPAAGEVYIAEVAISTGPSTALAYSQTLPDCNELAPCRLFAAPDLDRDGLPEIAIAHAAGVSSVGAGLYRFDPEAAPDGEALVRFQVADPGDPWHENFGILPGPATVVWYGSVTHLHWAACDEDPEYPGIRFVVLTALRDERDPSVYRVHGTILAVEGTTLRVASTWDEEFAEEDLVVQEDRFCDGEILPPA
jgi:hypothetical protein